MLYIKNYKNYSTSRIFHGLTPQQAYNLELECLKRLKDYSHMCQLTSYDSENLTLSLKWVGKSMMYFINQGKQIKTARKQAIKSNTPVNQDLTHCKLLLSKNEFINQWEVICKTLEENNIVHLDLWPTNICINNNVVTLIDFGKVIIDENPQSAKLEEEYQNFLTQGGYNFQKNQQLDKIFSKVNRKLSWV